MKKNEYRKKMQKIRAFLGLAGISNIGDLVGYSATFLYDICDGRRKFSPEKANILRKAVEKRWKELVRDHEELVSYLKDLETMSSKKTEMEAIVSKEEAKRAAAKQRAQERAAISKQKGRKSPKEGETGCRE